MKSIIKFFMLCAAVVGIACPTMAGAAGVTLTLSPVTSGTIDYVGDTASYTLSISGLHASADIAGSPALGSYDIFLNFDPSVLSVLSVDLGTTVNDLPWVDSTSVAGQLYLSNMSFSSPQDLEAGQPASFVLGTITFQGTGIGSSSIQIDPASSLGDENGNSLAVVNNNSSTATVEAVPEPSTYALAGLGVLVVLFQARRRVSRLA